MCLCVRLLRVTLAGYLGSFHAFAAAAANQRRPQLNRLCPPIGGENSPSITAKGNPRLFTTDDAALRATPWRTDCLCNAVGCRG